MPEKMNIEAIKAHILWNLWRATGPVMIAELKRKTLGIEGSFEELLRNLWELDRIIYKGDAVELSEAGKDYMSQMEKNETKVIQTLLFDKKIELAIIAFFYHRPHFVHIEDVPQLLKKEAGNLGHAIHQRAKYFEIVYMHWYKLNEMGRAYHEHHAQKSTSLQPQHRSTVFINNTSVIYQETFSEDDKKEMNTKIDHTIRMMEKEFNDIKLGQEMTYTDVMAELNEMREYLHLAKKTWRQLFTGKLAEMVVAGVVSETISHRIADSINPVIDKLIQ